jgi:hypothetical protein
MPLMVALRAGTGRARGVREVTYPIPDQRRPEPGNGAVRFGRKLKLAHQIAEAWAKREAGEALSDIGRSYNVSHSTISRL